MKKKRYFEFYGGDISALVVGSRNATAKIILHVPPETSGKKIFNVIQLLDKKIQRHRQARQARKNSKA